MCKDAPGSPKKDETSLTAALDGLDLNSKPSDDEIVLRGGADKSWDELLDGADSKKVEDEAKPTLRGCAAFDTAAFDDWADAMYLLMGSFSPYAWLYFVLIVLIAGFFVVNLFLAVVYLEFGSSKARVDASANQTKQPVAAALQDSGDMDALLSLSLIHI